MKKKMLLMCTIALICAGVLSFTSCAGGWEVILAKEIALISVIFWNVHGEEIMDKFRDYVFPDWAYGANEKEENPVEEGAAQ